MGPTWNRLTPFLAQKKIFTVSCNRPRKRVGVLELARKGLAFWPEERQERIIVWFTVVQGFPRVDIKEAGTNPARDGFVGWFRDRLIGCVVTSLLGFSVLICKM